MRATRERLRKATFNLSNEILVALDQAVRDGAAVSKNAFVERALEREIDELRRADRQAKWDQASRDPLFLKDVENAESSFRSADAETARTIG